MRADQRGAGGMPLAPRLRVVVLCCAVSWLLSSVSVALAVWRGDWLAFMLADIAAVSAAGWLVAARQWALWQARALALLAILAGNAPDDTPS